MKNGTPKPAPHWQLIERRGKAGLQSLEADWRHIYQSLPLRTNFLSYEACLSHVEHSTKEPDLLRCLVLSDGERVRGICVLEAGTHSMLKKKQRIWKVLYHWKHACEANILCADDEAHSAMLPLVVAHVRQRPEGRWLLRLGPSPEASPLWRQLPRLSSLSYYLDKNEVVSVFDCARSFEEFQAPLSVKFLRNLRRKKRRLSELEGVSLTTVTSLEEGFTEAYHAFLELEASGWKGEKGAQIAALCDPRQVAYLDALGTGLRSTSDHCTVTLLHAEGRCIAAGFIAHTGAVSCWLRTAYDESYSRVSPGDLLAEVTIERSCQDPTVAVLDMVSGAPWALGWQPRRIQLQRCWINVAPQPLRPIVSGLLQLRLGPVRRLAHRLRERKKA